MKNNSLVITIVIAVLVGALGFFGGMKYQQRRVVAFRGQVMGNFASGTRQNQGRGGMFDRPVSGEIIAFDDKSITVKLTDGSSKIVILSDKTTVNKDSEGSKGDLKEGVKVAAFGTENSDGSVTATNIQINPVARGSTN